MKNIKLFLASVVALSLPIIALAQMQPIAQGGPGVQVGSLQEIINSITNAMGLVFGAVAVICFLVAGMLFLTAQGSAEKIAAARQAFLWGVAGVVIGIISFSIIAIVASMIQ